MWERKFWVEGWYIGRLEGVGWGLEKKEESFLSRIWRERWGLIF